MESAAAKEEERGAAAKNGEPKDAVEQTAVADDPADEGFESSIEISPQNKQSGFSSLSCSTSVEALVDQCSLFSKLLMIEKDEWEAVRTENINLRSTIQQR